MADPLDQDEARRAPPPRPHRPPPGRIAIRQDERVALVGRTGSGKTFFARALLTGARRLVILDSKGTLRDWPGVIDVPISHIADDQEHFDTLLAEYGRLRVLISTPAEGETVARLAYHAGDLIVYIDEMYGVIPPGTRVGPWIQALYTRGRELGIGVWSGTQRPTWAPLVMFSEAEWFVVFQLLLEEDRRRVAGFFGEEAEARIPDRHGFWLFHISWPRPYYFAQLYVRRIITPARALRPDRGGRGEERRGMPAREEPRA